MKKTVTVTVMLLSLGLSYAQEKKIKGIFRFGPGLVTSLPTGDLKDTYQYGAGVEVAGIYGLGNYVQGFVETGLHIFKTKGFYASYKKYDTHLPVLLGGRYINNGIFFGAGIGYAKWFGNFENNTGLAFSPQAGYDIKNWNITAHYTGVIVSGGVFGYAGIKVFRVF